MIALNLKGLNFGPTLFFMFSYSTNPAKGSTQARKGLQDDGDILWILFGQFFGKLR